MQNLSVLAGSSHSKKTTGSKASASPSTSSTSPHPKASKETVSNKTGPVGITKGKKKTGKQPASRPSSDAATSGTTEPSETRVESLKTEQTVPGTEELTAGKSKSAVPPHPVAPAPSLPAPPLAPEESALDTPVVLVSNGADLATPTLDPSQPPWTEEPANRTTAHSGTGLSVSRENAKWWVGVRTPYSLRISCELGAMDHSTALLEIKKPTWLFII